MAINTAIAAGCFQDSVKTFKQSMLHFNFTTTISTYDMMVVATCNLIGQMSTGIVGWANQGIICKEFECTIHSRFGQTWQFLAGFFVNISRREMCPFVTQYM